MTSAADVFEKMPARFQPDKVVGMNAMTVFMPGKIKSDGDLCTVMQFQSVVGL